MTTIDHSAYARASNRSFLNAFVSAPAAVLSAAAVSFKRKIVAARTSSELCALSDRQLNDIGIERAMISDICTTLAARNIR